MNLALPHILKKEGFYPLFFIAALSCKTLPTHDVGRTTDFNAAVQTQQLVNDEGLSFQSAALHPSGNFIFISGTDNSTGRFVIKVWDTRWPPPMDILMLHTYDQDLKGVSRFPLKSLQAITFSNDGKYIAVADGSGFYIGELKNLATDKPEFSPLRKIYSRPASQVSFSDDGMFIAVAEEAQGSKNTEIKAIAMDRIRTFLKSGGELPKYHAVYTSPRPESFINGMSWHHLKHKYSGKEFTTVSIFFSDSHTGFHAFLLSGGPGTHLFKFASEQQHDSMTYHKRHFYIGPNQTVLLFTPELDEAELVEYKPISFSSHRTSGQPKIAKKIASGLTLKSHVSFVPVGSSDAMNLALGGKRPTPVTIDRAFTDARYPYVFQAATSDGVIYRYIFQGKMNDKKVEEFTLTQSSTFLCLPLEGDAKFLTTSPSADDNITNCGDRKDLRVHWMGYGMGSKVRVLYVVTDLGRVYQIDESNYR